MNPTRATQTSFAQAEYAKQKKRTRREIFLVQMEQVIPRARRMDVIELHVPQGGKRRRVPIALKRMLRIDEAVEDTIDDAQLVEPGLLMSKGALVDATLIDVPSSTKNREHARNPEMERWMSSAFS